MNDSGSEPVSEADKKVLDRFQQIAQRYIEILGKTADPVLIVLRGHLLIEEQLRELLDRSVKEARYLQGARLGYLHVLKLAQAILGSPPESQPWPVLMGLNGLRNKLAHRVEVPEFRSAAEELIRLGEVPGKYAATTEQEPAYGLTMTIGWASGILQGLIESHFYPGPSRTEGGGIPDGS